MKINAVSSLWSAPVLLLGGGGQLGTAFRQLFDGLQIPYCTFDFPDFDLLDEKKTLAWTSTAYSLVINAAAWTDVDGAESEPDKAMRANAGAVKDLQEACKKLGIPLVHYSTDYVFEGDHTKPYRVNAPYGALNVYGKSKALGESHLDPEASLLIRTSWVYSPWGKNFVKTIFQLSKEKPELKVVDDQRGRPTSAEALAKHSWDLIQMGARGIYHVSDEGECTWFELADFIVKTAGHSSQVIPCSSSEYPRPSLRPAYSVLDLSLTEEALNAMGVEIKPWQENVRHVIKALQLKGPNI